MKRYLFTLFDSDIEVLKEIKKSGGFMEYTDILNARRPEGPDSVDVELWALREAGYIVGVRRVNRYFKITLKGRAAIFVSRITRQIKKTDLYWWIMRKYYKYKDYKLNKKISKAEKQ